MINLTSTRYDKSAKKIRNEVELIILLYGNVLSYEDINEKFEISQKTFKRDIEVMKFAITTIFGEEIRIIKVKDKLAYKLLIPHKPYLLF